MNLEDFLDMVTDYKKIDGHGTGGPLHVVLDDMNVEGRSIRWCVNAWLPQHPCGPSKNPWWPEKWEPHDCTEQTRALAVELLLMSKKKRREWLEIWWASDRPKVV